MSFTGCSVCSVCSGEFVRDANGDPLYCPVCDAPSREGLERFCREGADSVATPIGVTTMVVMYKKCPDGSTDLVWWTRGFERDYKLALNTIANGLREVASRLLLGTAVVREAEEWQHHVLRDDGATWCGAPAPSWSWYFQSAEHARTSVEQEDRMQPCPDCWSAIVLRQPKVLHSWCFTNSNENDVTMRLHEDGRVTLLHGDWIEIPQPVVQMLIESYKREVPDGSRSR